MPKIVFTNPDDDPMMSLSEGYYHEIPTYIAIREDIEPTKSGYIVAHELGHHYTGSRIPYDIEDEETVSELDAALWAYSRRGVIDRPFMWEMWTIYDKYSPLEIPEYMETVADSIDRINRNRAPTSYKIPKRKFMKWLRRSLERMEDL